MTPARICRPITVNAAIFAALTVGAVLIARGYVKALKKKKAQPPTKQRLTCRETANGEGTAKARCPFRVFAPPRIPPEKRASP